MKNRQNYPENWNSQIRPAILTRDKFKCTICNVKQDAKGYYEKGIFIEVLDNFMENWCQQNNKKVIKIALQVMHLDQDSSNNLYDNLAAGCSVCHLKFDRMYSLPKRIMALRKPPNGQ